MFILPAIAQPAPPVPLARLVHVRARVVFAAVAAASSLLLATAPLRATYEVFSGTTVPAASMVSAPGRLLEDRGGQVLVPVVATRTVGVWSAIKGWLDPELEVARRETTNLSTDRDTGARHMRRAATVAGVLAAARLGATAPGADVPVDGQGFGGPSAGLAFTLELIDSLTPGELTGGRKVAVTGTIDQNGTVGPVGGVAQKTAAVKSAGAKYFLVPPDEYETAKQHAGRNLQVIKVATLEEALDVLGSLGGDVAALGPPPTTPRG